MSDFIKDQHRILCDNLTSEQFVAEALRYANVHHELATWKDKAPIEWSREIQEEVHELQDSITGWHEHTPALELMQIISCAINMHRRFYAAIIKPTVCEILVTIAKDSVVLQYTFDDTHTTINDCIYTISLKPEEKRQRIDEALQAAKDLIITRGYAPVVVYL